MTATTELLPCPFCCNDMPKLTTDGRSYYWVICMRCEAQVGWKLTQAEALAAWNARAPLHPEPDQPELARALNLADPLTPPNDVAALTAERDALRAQLEALTSEEAVDAAYEAIESAMVCYTVDQVDTHQLSSDAGRLAIEAALNAVRG
jgi:hypothetical protein